MDVSSPGSSLAEWSQKIKDLQQQVDRDGLQEQERLEAEIARSRMERARRRSTLTGNARIDQAAASYLSKLPDDVQTLDRQQAKSDTPQRLTGNGTTSMPASPTPAPSSSASSMSKPVSLAEFMGGRATGPRLNRHAPQTDFEEHARDYEARRNGSTPLLQRIIQPSPVALHGLAKETPKRELSTQAEKGVDTSTSSVLSSKPYRPNNSMVEPKVAKATADASKQSVPTSPLPINSNRTVSTLPSSTNNSSRSVGQSSLVSSPLGISVPEAKGTGNPSNLSQSSASPTPVTARWTGAISSSPLKSPPMSSPLPSSPPQVNTLARPVQPSASPVQHFVPPTNPSPAFLKPSPPKEERPSITRLQGRGFVERQVQASARLSSTPEEPQKIQRPTSSDRKLTVLERWPGEPRDKSSSTTPEKAAPVKRDFVRSLPPSSVRPSDVAGSSSLMNFNKPPPTRTRNFEHDNTPLRLPGMNGAGSLPAKSTSLPQPRLGGREDSTTRSLPVVASAPTRLPGLATEGITPSALRKSSSSSNLKQPSKRRSVHFEEENDVATSNTTILDGNQTDATNTKRLIHLTKDRARKPRKVTHGTTSSNPVEGTNPRVSDISEAISEPPKRKTDPALPSLKPPTNIANEQVGKSQPLSKAESLVSPVVSPATPSTPRLARTTSKEKNRLPPPIVAPKPAALRRNSLNSPMTPQQPSSAGTAVPNADVSSEVSSPPAAARTPSPTFRGGERETNELPQINVRAAVSTWSQQSHEPKKVDGGQPSSSGDIKHSTRADDTPPETQKHHAPTHNKQASDTTDAVEPLIIIPSVLNPPTIPMPQPRPRPVSQSSSERRRSITNRYSSIILPPLKEEKTPAATPEGSMRIQSNAANKEIPTAQALRESLVTTIPGHHDPDQQENAASSAVLSVETENAQSNVHSPVSPLDRVVSISHDNPPLPTFNLSRLLASIPAAPKLTPGSVISVEAFVISGSSSTAVKNNPHIFYESEIIAIVYRGKSKPSGLVATTVWAWVGAKATMEDKEEAKLQEMANRFNTSLIKVPQGKEPFELVQIMGGTVAIRHGSRSHWMPENTALHCVRAHGSHFIIIEQVELMSRNICSAFSYCLAILDALVVWYGRGSTDAERRSAIAYTKSITVEGVTPVELEEGVEDERFWMMLDEGEYANADFWKFRAQSPIIAPRLWSISDNALQPVIPLCSFDLVSDKVFMYDGIFELFVIVGEEARSRRDDIRLALAAAESVAAASAFTRSFPPPLHVLVFPTRIPLDLRANFRLMDYREASRPVPEHINLLTFGEASVQLSRKEWKLRDLKDPNFLPLAISPSMHPELTQ